jgi:hypothetical protein
VQDGPTGSDEGIPASHCFSIRARAGEQYKISEPSISTSSSLKLSARAVAIREASSRGWGWLICPAIGLRIRSRFKSGISISEWAVDELKY